MPVRGQPLLPLRGAVSEDAVLAGTPPEPKPIATRLEAGPVQADEPQPVRRKNTAADPYAPAGLGSTALRLYPSITAGLAYSNNVNGSASDPQDANGLRLKPNVKLESNWVRHSLTGGIDGDFIRYADHEDFNTGVLDIFQRLRLDIQRHTAAELEVRYALNEQGGIEATEHTISGTASLTHDFGPMAARLSGGLRQKYFEDVIRPNGTVIGNGDRDYSEPSAAIRAVFNPYAAISPFAEASVSPRQHDRGADRFGINRDSIGIGLTAGMEIDSDPFWSGEIGFTYLHRNYQASRLGSADGLGLTGSISWSPTELTEIVMAAGTALDEVASSNTGGRPVWTASIDATYALRDNIDVLTGAAVKIEGAGGERTYDASLGVSWKFSPVLAWTAGYDFTWLESAGRAGGDYAEHRLATGITVSR